MTYTFKPGVAVGEYEVYKGDKLLGTVKKREDRYNLRRALVNRYWVACAPEGKLSDRWGQTMEFARRLDAAGALASHPGNG